MENWSSDEEQLQVALVNVKAHSTDVSKSVNASALFRDVAKTISENCSITITDVDVTKKIQPLVGEFRSFIWFINLPGVYFLAERNWLFTTAEYLTRFRENESEEHKNFRIHGLPNFLILREIFVVRGLEFVDFEWIIMDLSGADKKWMCAPLDTA